MNSPTFVPGQEIWKPYPGIAAKNKGHDSLYAEAWLAGADSGYGGMEFNGNVAL